ncbi:MAG: tryptophan--tRNA ligase [Candidatus Marinimicrobia bacterium]|nr:tryptophan--tRNA ligase [Candidatus Neomarinimicrobiota bacterium]
MSKKNQKKRILSGMRPTGKMHLGNFVGALENWVELQNSSKYKNYHLIADYHVLTTDTNSDHILDNTLDMISDWLAVGIDPEKSPIFRQSQIKEHTELHLILSMLITKARLERNPTLKEQLKDLNMENVTYGHLGYPVLQAADIMLYRGEVVPVGEDQAPHVEITREIARRFNKTYGKVFPVPKTKLTNFARLPGLDRKKMSKSIGNTIMISDPKEEIQKKMMKAITDPQKIRLHDPGRPEVCLVFTYHQKFNPDEEEEIAKNCRSGDLGCVECKKRCAAAINEFLDPFREKRNYYAENKDEVLDIIRDGEKRAREVARETMDMVHDAMKIG